MIPALKVSGLKVSIRTDDGVARVLDDINLTLEPGRILGVVGESGCGKSTLIRAIMGILPKGASVDGGEIWFEGENLLVFTEKELNTTVRSSRIGFIPQDPLLSLNPVFKVGAQLLEVMRWHAPDDGSRGSERRKRHVARLVDLLRRMQVPDPENALERYPHQFSGGQRQRLLITAALACAPSLIIADEPTTALDVTTQHQILGLLRGLVGEFGISLLFVTHDFGVVAELCDDLCVIYAGQTVEAGTVDAVLRQPSHPYTRALLACHPDRATSFVGIPGMVPSPLARPPGCLFAARCADVPPVKAVAGVDLDLREGEILSLVGESGSGKTTLGRTLLGLQRETSGTIVLDGKTVSGLAPEAARRERRAIQYVHQDAGAALDPWWSVGRTLAEGLLIHGVGNKSERMDRVAAMLSAVGLDADSARRYPHEFSGGQLRRVALARILLLRPRVLILDEPTSGLDMSVQATVLNLLLELRKQFSLTYLFISHDLSVVERLSDRVAIMLLGRIVEMADAKQLFAQPKHDYTCTLLNAAPRLTGRRVTAPLGMGVAAT